MGCQKTLFQQFLCFHSSSRSDCSKIIAVLHVGLFWWRILKRCEENMYDSWEKAKRKKCLSVLGKAEKIIFSKHQAGAWEEHLDCWGLYRNTKDTGILQLDKKQEHHLIVSKKVKQNWKCWKMPHQSCGTQTNSLCIWCMTCHCVHRLWPSCTSSEVMEKLLMLKRKLVRSQIANYTDREKERQREVNELLGGTLNFVAWSGIKSLLRHKGIGSFQLQP